MDSKDVTIFLHNTLLKQKSIIRGVDLEWPKRYITEMQWSADNSHDIEIDDNDKSTVE